MGNLYSVLRTVYQYGNQAQLLNDGDYFLQQLATCYEPAFKYDCQLIERAVRQGAGNIVYQYLQQNSIPNASDTDVFLQQMQNRAGFSRTEAERAVGFLYYMVGWNEDGTTRTGQQSTPLRSAPQSIPSPRSTPSSRPASSSQPSPAPERRQAVRDFLSSKTGRIVLMIVLYIVYVVAIFAFVAVLGKNRGFMMPFTALLMVVTTFFGWKALTKIQPRMFVFMPGIGWALYFGIKTFLALCIGWFVTPYQFAKTILRKS